MADWIKDGKYPLVDPRKGFGSAYGAGVNNYHNPVYIFEASSLEAAQAFLKSLGIGQQLYIGEYIPDPPKPLKGAPEAKYFEWYYEVRANGRKIKPAELALEMGRKNNSDLRQKLSNWKKAHSQS